MFAQVPSAGPELAWVMNAGALTILGYLVVWGMPRMLRDMLESAKEERAAFDRRVDKIVAEMKATREAKVCRYPEGRPP